jgi:hypothetical protein
MGIRFRNLDEHLIAISAIDIAGAVPTNYLLSGDGNGAIALYAPFDLYVIEAQLRVSIEGITGGGPMDLQLANVSDSSALLTSTAAVTDAVAPHDLITLNGVGSTTPVLKGNIIALRATASALTGGTFSVVGFVIVRHTGNKEVW